MLPLNCDKWATLQQAYGDGRVIADWLDRLTNAASHKLAAAVWDEGDILFGSLLHQGTTYPATYAAIPHLVRFAQRIALPDDLGLRVTILHFVGLVAGHGVVATRHPISEDLSEDYEQALREARRLIAETLCHTDEEVHIEWLSLAFAGVSGCYVLFECIDQMGQEPQCQCGEILVCPDEFCDEGAPAT